MLAEHWFGSARSVRNGIYVEVGKGVGGEILSEGQFFNGRSQAEFGHITVEPGGTELCKFGKTGCLEAITSAGNIVRQYLERVKKRPAEPVNVGEVNRRARAGDRHDVAVLDRAVKALGLGLSYLMAIFNPELFILGGYFMSAEDCLLPRLRAELARHEREWTKKDEVVVSQFGMDIGLRGASALAFYRALDDPILVHRLCEPRTVKPLQRSRRG